MEGRHLYSVGHRPRPQETSGTHLTTARGSRMAGQCTIWPFLHQKFEYVQRHTPSFGDGVLASLVRHPKGCSSSNWQSSTDCQTSRPAKEERKFGRKQFFVVRLSISCQSDLKLQILVRSISQGKTTTLVRAKEKRTARVLLYNTRQTVWTHWSLLPW